MAKRAALITAAAIKWAGPIWLAAIAVKVIDRYLAGHVVLDWDLIGFALFSAIFASVIGVASFFVMRKDRPDSTPDRE